MKKHQSEEFKRETVRLIQSGRRLRQVADELGLNLWTVKGWVKKYGRQENANLVSEGIKLSPDEEIRLLKRELDNVTEERDILKKAIAVFSRKPKINMFL